MELNFLGGVDEVNARHCALPHDLTSGSGFATDTAHIRYKVWEIQNGRVSPPDLFLPLFLFHISP